jgi:hypothetical protein
MVQALLLDRSRLLRSTLYLEPHWYVRMNYELAKQLKDAGFPQKTNFGSFFYHEEPTEFGTPKVTKWLENLTTLQQPSCDVLCPTLEELIELCRERKSGFRLICGSDGIWNATLIDHSEVGRGSSPTEAVARLWLVLNKAV